ncbi:Gfo/Idh/MocA family protein [Romboutsia lituseburensis]|uniref:Oxidoreductase family, NAD-binding Rossmann fold n=1 Tax=Romboutsia lituseburensis DSM 797 TaxID=1121325 RepID=A0A1G9MZ65_9FIRM|nr:Gfo/Idh/MocA family oxidoreductase [Romboutsia lituseburensis]CEH34265.1 Oxidoreductase [Romboutsia lituseburensis]SDL79291.1 Oxidoreductase family, NAD-binding Rossmann fold [Romboutsia lituseburensis DSM 797]
MKKVKIAVVGAGSRGMYAYAPYLLDNPELGEIVAIAEPIDEKRDLFKNKYNLDSKNIFNSWQDLLANDKIADAIIIANNDDSHFEPAKLALEKGYHVLLEKPMSNDLNKVISLGELAKQYNNQVFMVCHVLRYTPFFNELKKIVESKELGELISIQHNENIGYWHFAHSYVRGNWRNSIETSPLILAKSCHDLDILLWLVDSPGEYISSFGNLSHLTSASFKTSMKDHCVKCDLQETCPYSAVKIYLEEDKIVRSLNAVHPHPTKYNLKKALQNGPYGRCVYKCDNNVVDHMVNIIEFKNKVTATFNLSAFTQECSRTIKLMFSHGEVGGNFTQNIIDIHKFGTNTHTIINPKLNQSGHGGGDYSLIKDFISSISSNDGELKTTAIKSVQSHVMAFAAEYSRISHKVINLSDFYNDIKENINKL